MSRLAVPALADITQLFPVLDSVVTDDLIDGNGHMSLPHYVAAGARAVWARKRQLGLDEVLAEGITFFVNEQHTRFLGELVHGDRFTAHPRFLTRSNRALHTVTYIVDVARQRLACSIESVSICVSEKTRRSADMPQMFADNLDDAIRCDATLPDIPVFCTHLWR